MTLLATRGRSCPWSILVTALIVIQPLLSTSVLASEDCYSEAAEDTGVTSEGSDSQEAMCYTSATVTTTVGVSLVQAMSFSRRITAAELPHEAAAAANAAASSGKSGSPVASVASDAPPKPGAMVEQKAALSDAIDSSLSAAPAAKGSKATKGEASPAASPASGSQAHQERDSHKAESKGSSEGQATHATLAGWHIAAAFFFLGLLLLAVGGVAYFVLQPPSAEGAQRLNSPQPRSPVDLRTYRNRSFTPQVPPVKGTSPTQPSAGPGGGPPAKGAEPPGSLSTSDEEQEDQMPRASAMQPEADAQFCPDLVVPQHCECILLVPFRTASDTSFSISDMNGVPVLNASPQRSPGGWKMVLATAANEPLAQCCEVRTTMGGSVGGASGNPQFHLLRAGGQYFAKLLRRPSQDRYSWYELTTLSGARLHYWGNFETQAVNVTDDQGKLLATTELSSARFDPDGHYFKLRVAPLADVGLSLCGLLCINHLLEISR